MMKNVILVFLFGLCSQMMLSRDFSDDMKKIREAYASNYVSMNITYKLYEKVKDVKPIEVQTLWLESFGNLLHYKGQGQDVLYTETNMLIIDEDEKEMVLDTVTAIFNKPGYEALPIDTTVSRMESITMSEQSGGIVQYTLIPKNKSEIVKAIISINILNWTIQQIEIHSSPSLSDGKVIIQYSQINKKQTVPEGTFKLSKYLMNKKGGGYTTSLAYKDYKFYHRNNNFKTK